MPAIAVAQVVLTAPLGAGDESDAVPDAVSGPRPSRRAFMNRPGLPLRARMRLPRFRAKNFSTCTRCPTARGSSHEPATNDEERAGLLNTLVAYTGTYRVEGDKWITKVEVAWNPEWVGSEQIRFFKLNGDRLEVVSPWRVMPNWPNRGMTRSILTFDRSK
jgi:hypothetical protein